MRGVKNGNIRIKNRWRNKVLLVVSLVGMSCSAFAQIGLQLERTHIFSTTVENTIPPTKSIPSLTEVFKQSTISETPKSYCYQELAFFCKIEVQLEKASKLPVKFRLGDVQYVDYLEGKRDEFY